MPNLPDREGEVKVHLLLTRWLVLTREREDISCCGGIQDRGYQLLWGHTRDRISAVVGVILKRGYKLFWEDT